MRLASHVPLFIPLALIIVLLPLLTEDPWRLATEARGRIAVVAVISVIPLTLVLIRRIMKMDVQAVFEDANGRIENESSRFSEAASRLLGKMRDSSSEPDFARDSARSALEDSYRDADDHLPEAIRLTSRALRVEATQKLLVLIAGISLAVWSLIYLLAVAAMPVSLAERWSGHDVALWQFSSLGLDVCLPLGPYLLVSGLLATVACVGFLGFVLTEDQYSESLWQAVLHRTAEDCLMLAVPYLALRGEREASG
jgi:hypothetical protein